MGLYSPAGSDLNRVRKGFTIKANAAAGAYTRPIAAALACRIVYPFGSTPRLCL